jgi:hypothetical protein
MNKSQLLNFIKGCYTELEYLSRPDSEIFGFQFADSVALLCSGRFEWKFPTLDDLNVEDLLRSYAKVSPHEVRDSLAYIIRERVLPEAESLYNSGSFLEMLDSGLRFEELDCSRLAHELKTVREADVFPLTVPGGMTEESL